MTKGRLSSKHKAGVNFHLTAGLCITNRTAQSIFQRVASVAKPELGNKHQCQNCGTRFFDLNKSPAVCPKCGTVSQSMPLARASQSAVSDEDEAEAVPAAELVPLEEADAGDDKVAVTADDEVEIEPADDPFLEEEEEDNDDVGDLIDGEIGEEEER